jgi:hypothetical protein
MIFLPLIKGGGEGFEPIISIWQIIHYIIYFIIKKGSRIRGFMGSRFFILNI